MREARDEVSPELDESITANNDIVRECLREADGGQKVMAEFVLTGFDGSDDIVQPGFLHSSTSDIPETETFHAGGALFMNIRRRPPHVNRHGLDGRAKLTRLIRTEFPPGDRELRRRVDAAVRPRDMVAEVGSVAGAIIFMGPLPAHGAMGTAE
jgi:hypothetical protein